MFGARPSDADGGLGIGRWKGAVNGGEGGSTQTGTQQ